MPEYREKNLQDLGREVKQKREEQGLSLKDVYEGTKIRIQFLEGIEKGDFSEFPGTVYVRGFIRTYLQFIELELLWQDYLPVLSEGVIEPVREQEEEPAIVGKCAPPTKGFKPASPFWIFAILLLIAVGSSWYVWYTWDRNGPPPFTIKEESISQDSGGRESKKTAEITGGEEDPSAKTPDAAGGETSTNGTDPSATAANGEVSTEGEIAVPLEGIKTPPTAAELVGAAEPEAPAAAPEAKKDKELVITADGDCWVRVRQGNKTLFERTIKAGDRVAFTVQARIEVTYGRSGSVKTRWNGKDLGHPGATRGVEKVFYAPDGTTGTIPR